MTPRERVMTALRRGQPDMVPCEKWGVRYPRAFADQVLRYLRRTLDDVDGLEDHSPSME